MYASELSTRRAVYVVEVNANEWHACYDDGTVWNGGWFLLGDFRMAEKFCDDHTWVGTGDCPKCVETWKDLVPDAPATTGRAQPEPRRAFWRFGEHERKPGMSPAFQADYAGLELRVLAHSMEQLAGHIAYEMSRTTVMDIPTARALVDATVRVLTSKGPVMPEELCIDEGCPHHGTPHVCTSLEEELRDLLAEGVAGTFHCTRVWAAWGVGTMSQDDFEPVEDSDTPTQLAQAVMTKVRPLMEHNAELSSILDSIRRGMEMTRDGVPYEREWSATDDKTLEKIYAALGLHVLYTDADKDRSDVICDSNGQVVLGLCKRCGKGEAELTNEDGTPSPCKR